MSHESKPSDRADLPEKGYEVRDADPRLVIISILVLVAIIAVVLVAMSWGGPEPRPDAPPVDLRAPARAPVVIESAEALKEFVAAQETHLTQYRWVNEEADIFQIPVERAMDIVAQGGLESREAFRPPPEEK